MRPLLSSDDTMNESNRDGELRSQLAQRYPLLPKGSHFSYLSRCQFSGRMRLTFSRPATSRILPPRVFGTTDPFQVRMMVVGSVAIYVINGGIFKMASNKRQCNETMNIPANYSAFPFPLKPWVASDGIGRGRGLNALSYLKGLLLSFRPRSVGLGSNSAVIGNLKDFLIAGRWFPSFHVPTFRAQQALRQGAAS